MANQAGPEIVAGTAVPAGGEPSAEALARTHPGTLNDPGHQHAAYHGRPVSWVAVTLIVAGFLCGGLALVFGPAWAPFWAGVGLTVVGALLAAGTDMFEDWY
jgi:hypothetical protein